MNIKHALAIAATLALFGHAHAAELSFSCPANPAPGTTATLGPIVTNVNWSVVSEPAGTPATTVAYQHPAWVAPVDGAIWLSIAERNTPVPFIFTSDDTINVDPSVVDVASITVVTRTAVDNYLDHFIVTPPSGPPVMLTPGLPVMLTPRDGFESVATNTYPDSVIVPAHPAPGFQAGINSIGFMIRNGVSTQNLSANRNPMGLFASVTLTATCLPARAAQASQTPVPVDTPFTLAGVGVMLAGLAGWRLRRKCSAPADENRRA